MDRGRAGDEQFSDQSERRIHHWRYPQVFRVYVCMYVQYVCINELLNEYYDNIQPDKAAIATTSLATSPVSAALNNA